MIKKKYKLNNKKIVLLITAIEGTSFADSMSA